MVGIFGIAGIAQLSVAALVLAHGTWWTTLSLVALPRPKFAEPMYPAGRRMAVVVPAHNEEAMIGATIDSLARSAAGTDCTIVVVADNCEDRTAEVARAHGAVVIERVDHSLRGKPFALRFALDFLANQAKTTDVVAIVDADTEVSDSFVPAMAERVAGGARAVQAHYLAGEAGTDLGRLRAMAFALIHWSRPLGASRLGLGMGLKGNGMAFSWDAARVAVAGDGLAEDAAAALALAERGIAVAFEPRAWVRGFMAQTYAEARTQDARWEGGRTRLVIRSLAVGAKRLASGDFAASAAALDTASLPLSLLALLGVAGLAASTAGVGSFTLAALAVASLASYASVGLVAARTPIRNLGAVVGLPRFALHKFAVYARIVSGRGASGWERTRRAER